MINPHHAAIIAYYGDRTAARSGVSLLNHIAEGRAVLQHIGAAPVTIDAFCIHPLLQSDADLCESMEPGSTFNSYTLDQRAVALAMEYRRVANNYLSKHCVTGRETIELSDLPQVNQMLIADKVQNLKDFERYHLGTHPKSAKLVMYFENWLRNLAVSDEMYAELRTVMQAVTPV